MPGRRSLALEGKLARDCELFVNKRRGDLSLAMLVPNFVPSSVRVYFQSENGQIKAPAASELGRIKSRPNADVLRTTPCIFSNTLGSITQRR